MKKTYFLFLSFLLLIATDSYSQKGVTKEMVATRIDNPPEIDGVLKDSVWKVLPEYGDFNMFEPGNEGNIPEDFKSTVQVAYDDKAIYIAASLKHPNPDEILKQFSQRDNVFVQADHFAAAINTYNDGINETWFYITSAGTIADSRAVRSRDDFEYNVVWEGRVSYDDTGWYVEYKIPYNALRFPEVEEQKWGINFYRRLVQRNEVHTWNFIDRSQGIPSQYSGILTGIKNITPPTRLLLFPFTQGVYTSFDGESLTDFSFGMDLKYGISDAFTLDATLIPDFGQVAFDNVQLNLGPFEQIFSEQRQFFTEGVELFEKGDIFFSRRIGDGPSGRVSDEDLNENETIIDVPERVQLLNAIKVSGRTEGNLGIGVLNAITEKTEATIRDTVTGADRNVVVEPITNYNVISLDQQFNQNSSVSLVNTNVIRSGSEFRDANVTAGVFDIALKENSYRAAGRAVFSNVNSPTGLSTGFRSEFDFLKIKGNWRWRVGHDFANRTLDINDLGVNFTNNFNSFVLGGSYEIFEPTKTFNRYRFSLRARHRRLYKPDVFTGNSIDLDHFFVTVDRFAFGGGFDYNSKRKDFFEPRIEGRFVTFPASYGARLFVSSDYRKKFAYDLSLGGRQFIEDDGQSNLSFEVSPRYRFSDKFLVVLRTEYGQQRRNFGWVDNTETEVYLGLRDISTLENSISASYNFDSYKALNLRFRNFWSTADYSGDVFYLLDTNGARVPTDAYDFDVFRDPNQNFNIWNLDLSYSWRFAPGSQATLLYRNQIFNLDQQSSLNYQESLENLLDQPGQHTFSLRIVYFIDYNNAKDWFRKSS
ncbi:DUF5916 domain-containing protein [Croceiramulus getboli]|nr:DUF5916 domain-containing protein [Flavobacteriaceae bacterium YJPT1-3]